MTLGFDEAHYRQALAKGIPYTAMVPRHRNSDIREGVVYDYAEDLLGAATVKVK